MGVLKTQKKKQKMQNESIEKALTPLEITVQFLRNVRCAREIKGSRGVLDIYTDHAVRSVSEPTLASAMELLMRSTQAAADKLSPVVVAKMAAVASSADAPRVLRWLREHCRLAVMLSATNDQALVSEVLADMPLLTVDGDGVAAVRQPFDIPISAACESPLAHGADGKAGNATLFRRVLIYVSRLLRHMAQQRRPTMTTTATYADAPELLAALEAAREFITDGMAMGFVGMPEDENILDVIEKAISKAKGINQ